MRSPKGSLALAVAEAKDAVLAAHLVTEAEWRHWNHRNHYHLLIETAPPHLVAAPSQRAGLFWNSSSAFGSSFLICSMRAPWLG